jgi:hypothetical protein
MVRTTVDQVDQVCPVNGKTGMFKSVDEFTEKEEVDQARSPVLGGCQLLLRLSPVLTVLA